ncbi:uncharacterized protein LOC115213219 [Octopus sinensis]|uniref:Uncharacterized protein LOC115213219 n=1 Tax=Octopus sinensis TaxID=2607531 RepID=A0A6P7SHX7_9MOLL|nr:uncharacterized protein LOC115213219 [Octopus sinensis]
MQRQYFSVFRNSNVVDLDSIRDVNPQLAITDIIFGAPDILTEIDKIKHNSAVGPDKFPATVLKICRHQIAAPLAELWRNSLDAGYIPDNFLSQSVVPVFKKGNKSLAMNYRRIPLTSHVIKVFESMEKSRITHFLEDNNQLNPNQHGVCDGRDCLSQLLHHFDDILKAFGEGSNTDVIYLDFRVSSFPKWIKSNLSSFKSILFFSAHWTIANRSD